MACSKVTYVSRQDAKQASGKKSGNSTPYKCPKCLQYHLTSMTKRELRAVKKRTRAMRGLSPAEIEQARAQAKQINEQRKVQELEQRLARHIVNS